MDRSMQVVLIATLVSATLMSRAAGAFLWDGTYTPGTCNQTACCCPSLDVVISNNSAMINAAGLSCPANSPYTISIDPSKGNVNVANVANLTLNGDKLTVAIYQNNTVTQSCATEMNRKQISTGSNVNSTQTNNVDAVARPLLLLQLGSSLALLPFIIHL